MYGRPPVPNGRLELSITTLTPPGTRKTWVDGKQLRLEQCLGAFVAQLEVVAETIKAHRLGLERQSQEREERRRKEQEAKARAVEEAEREKQLEGEFRDWRVARDIREYASELRRMLDKRPEMGRELVERVEWMEAYADRVDPLSNHRTAAGLPSGEGSEDGEP